MILAVVGSHILTPEQGKAAWPLVMGLILFHDPMEVVTGDATGIDSVVREAAKMCGFREPTEEAPSPQWPLTVYAPGVREWNPPGGNGYMARNAKIVGRLQRGRDKLVRVAKRVNQSTYGSGWTADRAREVLGADDALTYYL
ncbi:hypothetical protein ACFP2T_35875 [Plantactinospora solaniradicis]|uniref:HD domain-containing protein n=1 Tax=Plantactinospora solaniradicis TaxID=1723736 RepID=A0ABW1KIH0_9ACTN